MSRKCHWCNREGDWPQICMSTRDMEEKTQDEICDATLLRLGGGEMVVNQIRARQRASSAEGHFGNTGGYRRGDDQ